MKRQLFPTTVLPTDAVPRLTVAHSRIVVLSPISTVVSSPLNLRSCGIPDTTADGNILQFFPILAPFIIVALGPIQVPSPITTFPAMYANGSTVTSLPSMASGWIKAKFEIINLLFVFYYLGSHFTFKYQLIANKSLTEHGDDTSSDNIGQFHFKYYGIARSNFLFKLKLVDFEKVG